MTLALAPMRRAAPDSGTIRSMQAGANTSERQDDVLPRVARGDRHAVRECLDRYGGLVWSLARRLSTTEADAEDAVQEIFLDVWKSAARFDSGVASEVTFIAMIARRRLIDRRRKEGRRPDEEGLIEGAYEARPEAVDAPSEQSEDVDRAKRALGQLSQEQQRVLQLSIFHGLSHEKIARATDLPLGTVKTHARRGLIRIREIIEREEQEQMSARGDEPPAGVTR